MDSRGRRIERVLTAGTRAPSLLNSQPWSVVSDGAVLQVRADPARRLDGIDPSGREMFISCGAFLMNVRVAAEHEGFDAAVRLLPDRDDELLVATVTLGPGVVATIDEPGMFAAILTRHTLRGNARGRVPEVEVLKKLRRAVRREQADVVFLGAGDISSGHLVSEMRRAEAAASTSSVAMETDRSWMGVHHGRPDGVPMDVMRAGYADPITDVHQATRDETSGARTFEGRQHLAILTTVGDGPYNWLVAGQALERMLLVAATHDVQAAFATRALENPATRHEIETAYCPDASAQMLLRLARSAPGPHTPRRDVDDVVARIATS
ncbi:Acg family FMN-binding oxidoreductase [Cellulosimicrobium cellulans]|uniref:Acg family FMN-binding oxidoreductase n=1 Tax=Cellulosimicrobium cellulans TaxID=1710 RepID=UPI0024054B28|nr:hypothetical protein [Cellulosimicrobium cellulans]MDF9878260.1 putative metal-dependent enzyme (double-stranded beta helix superfamily) [Cellulosimicrobium cellulans]